MSGMFDLWLSVRRSVTVWTVALIIVIGVGLWFCGKAQAASIEARVGDRDGATLGVAGDATFHVERSGPVTAGFLLEFGEDDSVTLMGRLSKVWPGRVVAYAGLGAGIAIEEVPTIDTFHQKYRGATDREAGLAVEAFAGLRGAIKPGVVWLVEAQARDVEVNDGFGVSAGLRFRCGQ